MTAVFDPFRLQIIRSRLLELGLNQGLYADVHFLLDNGTCPAHRPLLMARCDVMDAMFAGDFRESSAKVASSFLQDFQHSTTFFFFFIYSKLYKYIYVFIFLIHRFKCRA